MYVCCEILSNCPSPSLNLTIGRMYTVVSYTEIGIDSTKKKCKFTFTNTLENITMEIVVVEIKIVFCSMCYILAFNN